MRQRRASSRASARGSEAFPVSLAALAAALLFGLFVLLGFPYDLLARRLAAQLEPALGVQVTFASVGPGLSLAGPGLTARGVSLVWPPATTLQFDRLRLRPAWSLSWLRGRPALRIGLAGELGRLDATAWLGSDGRFAGEVHELDLERVPVETWRPGVDFAGTLDGQFDLAREGPTLTGAAHFEARDGFVAVPVLPLPVPYAELTGELRLPESGPMEVTAFALEGPMLGITLQGSIGPAQELEDAPLRLNGQLRVSDPALRQAFAAQNVRLSPNGTAKFGIAGTVSAPTVQ